MTAANYDDDRIFSVLSIIGLFFKLSIYIGKYNIDQNPENVNIFVEKWASIIEIIAE